jgi:monofunctional chorismate mutase
VQLSDLRVRLDQMTDRIVMRLKDRSRFPLNPRAYQPDGIEIAGRQGMSFLDFALEGLEAYHASLGRYNYPGEFPLVSANLPQSSVVRSTGGPALPSVAIAIKDDLLRTYLALLPSLCPPGEDPDTYGETVYTDADLLQLLHERINVGRYVAQAKLASDPALASMKERDGLAGRLRDATREEALLASVRETAARYQVDQAVVEQFFRWIMQETLEVEVSFLQGLPAQSPLL